MERISKKTYPLSCLTLAYLSTIFWLFSQESIQSPSEAALSFEQDLKPLLSEFCIKCHGDEKQKADLNLQLYLDSPDFLKKREMWINVMEMIQEGEMPPEKQPQPEESQKNRLLEFIGFELAKFDCDQEQDPGRVTVRRLNRNEYNNTIRDLLGLDFKPAADFPNDEVGYGFDNIGDVLSLPPLLMEKYLDAAEKIADEAIVGPGYLKPPKTRFQAESFPKTNDIRPIDQGFLGIYRTSSTSKNIKLNHPGRYLMRVRAYGDQAGLEAPKLEVKLDDERVKIFSVRAEKRNPRTYSTEFAIKNPEGRLKISYTNNYVDNDHPDPKQRGDRNLFVDFIEFEGPLDQAPPEAPLSHRLVIFKQPGKESLTQDIRDIIRRFAGRAYRRPASKLEIDRLMNLYTFARKSGDSFEGGIKLVIQTVLVSPNFLFRWELDPQTSPASTGNSIGDYELASRLSYFLWSSMPDENLSYLAELGILSDPDILQDQVQQMLQDSKAEALVDNFAEQWLQIRNLDHLTPDPEMFPEFNDQLRFSMKEESRRFFATIIEEDLSILNFIDSDFTILNETLAEHYGISDVKGDKFRKVKLSPETGRGGILTQASILTITSNPTRTSPVKRGLWILEQILDAPPPPPPPNIEPLPEDKESIESASLRQRMELHRSNPECANCHDEMDAIGFAFENFNAIGRWRERDGHYPIDPSGTLPKGESFEGSTELKIILKSRENFIRAFSKKMLTFALGRGLEYYDECAVNDLCETLEKNDYRFSALIYGITAGKPFQMRRTQEPQS